MTPDLPPAGPRKAAHTGRLVLTTADPHISPDADLVVETLGRAGLLAEPLAMGDGQRFRIGPSFLSLLAFAGCAVRVDAEPSDDAPFCHIHITPSTVHPRLLSGRNTRPPRCMSCRERLTDWRDRRAGWAAEPHAGVACPRCGETRPPWLWDWKLQGGFGRLFVTVEEVFPNEATPTQSLFDLLIRSSGQSWRHFYVQD